MKTFNLHSLGWHSFQQLCLSIVRDRLGQTVEAFLDSKDAGRDGAFSGTWQQHGTESLTGKFVIQCKFTGRQGYNFRASDIDGELKKVRALVEQGACDTYVLITNAGISGAMATKIGQALTNIGVKSSLVLGRDWIEAQIRESSTLRMMVPRVYGLGDLTQIIDERAYEQAAAVLETMRDDLSKVVVTDAYRKAARALSDYGFVLLVGEPASGKTTIASMLAMASADSWQAQVIKADNAKALVDHWNPKERSQFFWIDDAFGVTQYESSLSLDWNHAIAQIKTILARGSKIVMTSRDYIYNRARRDLKTSAFPLLQESQVVIDVQLLSKDERQQILYNHLKLGGQPNAFLRKIKPYLGGVALHARFIPEIARRLSDPFFTRDVHISKWSLDQFVERREDFLVEVCENLDADSKAALALIYMNNGKLVSPISATEAEAEALARLGSSLGGCTSALEALRGSIVSYVLSEGESYWTFRHPTIGDAYSVILRSSPEMMSIYLQGSEIEKLLDQITCGDVGLEGSVVVPKNLYQLVVDRILNFSTSAAYKTSWMSSWGARRRLLVFLTRRCDRDFLSLYITQNPELVPSLSNPGLYLSYSAEASLAIRLHEVGLLPDDVRADFVQVISAYAVDGADAFVLSNPRARAMLTDAELEELRTELVSDLVPKLEQVRTELQTDRRPEDSAEEHMRRFLEVLGEIEVEFPQSKTVQDAVKEQRSKTQEWIVSTPEEEPEGERDLAVSDSDEFPAQSRSIFDDIDR